MTDPAEPGAAHAPGANNRTEPEAAQPPALKAPIVVAAPEPEPAEEPSPQSTEIAIEEPTVEEPAVKEPAPEVKEPAPEAKEPAPEVTEPAPKATEAPQAANVPADVEEAISEPLNETLPVALEPELRRIIDTAVARVASIELEAIRESRRLTQRTEEEGREALKYALDRAFQLVNSFELLTVTVAGMVSALRVELDAATAALNQADDPYARLPPALDENAQQVAAVTEPEPIPDAGGVQGMNGDGPELLTEPSIEMTEMFREQIINMKSSGKTKAEAERTLLRFNLGRRFIGLLDEIYTEDSTEAAAPAGAPRKRFARRFFSRQ